MSAAALADGEQRLATRESHRANGEPSTADDAPLLALGIDAGGSSTRWLLVDEDGEAVASGAVGPVSAIDLPRDPPAAEGEGAAREPAAHMRAARMRADNEREGATGVRAADIPSGGGPLANLEALALAVSAVGRPRFTVAGVTGLDTLSQEAIRLEGFLAGILDVPAQRVRVLGDVVTAYLASFAPGGGVLVYGGTGSVAAHVAVDGSLIRVGGHGYLIDDAGGGYWIGREALRRVLRTADESGGPAGGALASAIYADLGGSDWPTIRRAVYDGGRSRVAALTPLVAVAAGRGDRDALAVLAAAGTELARLATVVFGRIGHVLPVALAGGVARCGAPLVTAVNAGLPSGTVVAIATTSPVEAAASVARQLAAGEATLPAPWSPN